MLELRISKISELIKEMVAAARVGAAGAAGDFAANGNMNRDDKIAAAIVLRGMAASGKFAHAADAAGATGIKKGMKIDDCCC
ncbi:variable large family protein [Borreliella lusitaniae]|uniref:variable large family protein n=1 Tax=Borreliella lusitaniae TaxID=100177 RepID=UPI003C749343